MALRAMRLCLQDLLVSTHQKAASLPTADVELGQRTKLLLDTLLAVKNNRQLKPAASTSFWIKPGEVAPLQLSGLSWTRLVAPDKRVRSLT